ncbi:MAG: TonB-dependent receptor [Bacteroidales bacterium]|nr:TonB-dependent receptor [Bacteroidales bacterium]
MFGSLLIATAALFSVNATDSLGVAVVSADRTVIVSRVDTVSTNGAISSDGLADVLELEPGLQINDYGSYTGVKNVSIRGMGASNTVVKIDGIVMSNVQSGQIDLGMLGLDGVNLVSVDYVNSTLNLRSGKPVFTDGNFFSGKAGYTVGMYGTHVPSLRLNFRLSDYVSMSAYANGILYKGDFLYDGVNKRTGNDLVQARGGLDFFGNLTDMSGEWKIKAYLNGDDRGCPGSISWPATERQKDLNTFIQGSLRKNFTDVYSLRVGARGSYDYLHYIGAGYDNTYKLIQALASAENQFIVCDWFNISLDAVVNAAKLSGDTANASRIGGDLKVSAFFVLPKFKAELSACYTGAYDRHQKGRGAFLPLAALRYKPLPWLELTLSGRRTARIPSFNDLYYVGMGNPDLRTEKAWMTDAGLGINKKFGESWRLRAGGSIFFNHLTDKIVAAPTEDPMIWTMYNLGEAKVYGIDPYLGAEYGKNNFSIGIMAKYNLQAGTRIPYQPRQKAVLSLNASLSGWMLNLGWNVHSSAVDSYGNVLPSWNTLDLTLSKSWRMLTFKLAGRNITNRHYEIISGYPMQAISVLGSVEIAL